MTSRFLTAVAPFIVIGITTLGFNKAIAQTTDVLEPEAATGFAQKQAVVGNKFMVAAANPYASQAGLQMLEQGGSAVDAAIAAQLVLALVEPQSSGLGGGTFILHWDNQTNKMSTINGRETAPASADPTLFLDQDGQPVRWIDAVVGGRSVGVPGLFSALKLAHDHHGVLPWATLFEPAIALAERGFIVSARLEKLVSIKMNPGIAKLTVARDYFFPNGQAIKAGQRLVNLPFAKVLKAVAKEGIDVFYRGWIADDIVKAVQQAEVAPGLLAKTDLANYQASFSEPVCQMYRQYNLCGMAPPSSGGIAVIQILKQLEPYNMAALSADDVQSWHLFSQSSRLAFADRALYLADPKFVAVPVNQLIDKTYLYQRSKLINVDKDMGEAIPGIVAEITAQTSGNDFDLPSTSHISVVDGKGNAVSMTSSIEMGFGSAVMVNGFLLNNQLTDFSLAPKIADKWVANRVEGGKQPRSSMAPMMVFDAEGKLNFILGSPGGSRIINYVAQTLVAMLDWQYDPQAAINLPRITNRNQYTTLEKGTWLAELAEQFEQKGHQVKLQDLNSGIQAIQILPNKLIGGADPRREGVVLAK